MANNNEQFKAFNNTIKLSDSKKEELRRNRDALRERIQKYFKENKADEIQPKFGGQGSFMMHTTLNPISTKDESGKILYEYDVDDGVYFIGNETQEERYSVGTYHQWIVDAVDGHTDGKPTDKTTCVRVNYADGHHVDLPIYYKREVQDKETGKWTIYHPELAHKNKGWMQSDPKAFYQWVNAQTKEEPQLRRIIRYLKAWKNYKDMSYSTKLPSGFMLTILVCDNFCSSTNRDDIAMRDTLKKIQKTLKKQDGFKCLRPTVPVGEDLFSGFSDSRKDHFLNLLDSFVDAATVAVETSSTKNGCLKWQKHLGDRFCCSAIKDDEANTEKSYCAPAIRPKVDNYA